MRSVTLALLSAALLVPASTASAARPDRGPARENWVNCSKPVKWKSNADKNPPTRTIQACGPHLMSGQATGQFGWFLKGEAWKCTIRTYLKDKNGKHHKEYDQPCNEGSTGRKSIRKERIAHQPSRPTGHCDCDAYRAVIELYVGVWPDTGVKPTKSATSGPIFVR